MYLSNTFVLLFRLNYACLYHGNRFIMLTLVYDLSLLFFLKELGPWGVAYDCLVTLLNVIFRRNDKKSAGISMVGVNFYCLLTLL